MNVFYKFQILILLLTFLLSFWIFKPDLDSQKIYGTDGLRYANYAVSLHEYNVFGLQNKIDKDVPTPGNANAPFYPFFITAIMSLDRGFADSLGCVHEKGVNAECPENYNTFFLIQILISVLTLYLIYVLAFKVTSNKILSFIAAGLAFLSGIFQEYSFAMMTEVLILPFFTIFLIFCINYYKNPSFKWILAIGGVLAILTLIRPSYLYLFYGAIFFFLGLWFYRRQFKFLSHGVLFVLGFLIIISPWAIRNKINFDSFALTAGGYAEAILIQRTNYNQMSWSEIGVAMIYWLPDFGDSVAQKFFPPKLSDKLGWSKGTYYAQGYGKKYDELKQRLGSEEKILGYLIKEEILSTKHIAVSIPLALRGSFIAKYWGLLGFFAFLMLIFKTVRLRNHEVLIISLPLLYMIAFHAGLSVSIPRYNSPLIILYSLSMAYYIHFYGQKIVSKIRN